MRKREPEILYEDAYLIVCVKPAGMATQTARPGEADVVSFCRNRRAAQGEEPYIGLVHRLDQPVEGILVLAKDRETAAGLSRSMQTDRWKKEYCAGVRGIPEQQQGTLTDWLKKEPKGNCSGVVPQGTPGAKKAVLSYQVMETDEKNERALLRVILETGRHHQIRVQLSHAGHPLLGDRKYAPQPSRASEPVGSLHLCACGLEFVHPVTGENMHFSTTPSWRNELYW